jgi:hypothetical protein
MRKIQTILIIAACLFFVSIISAQKAKVTMTNDDVVEMVKGGLEESTVVLAIQNAESNFDTSPKVLVELSKQGVSKKILEAMMQPKPKKTPTTPDNSIATKEIGSLRVVLKSVIPIVTPQNRRDVGNGIRCSFEFTNLDTQKPFVVALNSENGRSDEFGHMRSSLVDENGSVMSLVRKNVIGGISKVEVGYRLDPADIASLLLKRDKLNSNFENNSRSPFVLGEMTEIAPEQTVTVTMTFFQDRNQANLPKVFRLESEIVVGVLTSGTKKSYTLHNLIFDRVVSR